MARRTIFSSGVLAGEARISSDLRDLVPERVDFLFGASGWDDRCRALTRVASLSARMSVLVTFEDKGSSGRAARNDADLRDYYGSRGGVSHEIAERSQNLEGIWQSLSSLLLEAWRAKGSALDVLVDLSACPRYLPLGLLASGVEAGIIRQAHFLYNEAEYSERHQPDLFTKGSWEAIEIPGFVGARNPGGPRRYIVSVGFEGAKTLRFVNRADPDRVTILFPTPGYRTDYPGRTWKQNGALFDDCGIQNLDDSSLVKARAGDAISAWQALTEAAVENFVEENVYYLCCGPKPHSLALALRALACRAGAVVYAKPSAHRESEISPSAEYWCYTIEDRSIPSFDARVRG